MRADVDITLVNPRPKFVERIRLHQFVAGNYDADGRLRHAARRGHPAGRRQRHAHRHRRTHGAAGVGPRAGLRLRHLRGRQHRRDAVVGARCGRIRLSHSRTGVRAAAARQPGRAGPEAPVTVVGAGLTGIETAAELAEQGRKVTLVCGGRWRRRCQRAGSPVRRQVAGQAWCHRPRGRRRSPRSGRTRWCSPTVRCVRAR